MEHQHERYSGTGGSSGRTIIRQVFRSLIISEKKATVFRDLLFVLLPGSQG